MKGRRIGAKRGTHVHVTATHDGKRGLVGVEDLNRLGNILRGTRHVDACRGKVGPLIPDVDTLGLVGGRIREEDRVGGDGTQLVTGSSNAVGDQQVTTAVLRATGCSRAGQ